MRRYFKIALSLHILAFFIVFLKITLKSQMITVREFADHNLADFLSTDQDKDIEILSAS